MGTIAIIDYGVGNLRSVEKAFAANGVQARVTAIRDEIKRAEKLVLPGVGAFGSCMRGLSERGFDKLVIDRVNDGVPLLGVCVGMQILFEESEEFGCTKGLGILKGRVRRFDKEMLVPQVGWNSIRQCRQHLLFAGIPDDAFFYFVHSYYCEPEDSDATLGITDYGSAYTSIVAKGNVCGVQFHPEKSQAVGLKMLANFWEFVSGP